MSFEDFAKWCRETYPTATEVHITVRPFNAQVGVIYDQPEPYGRVLRLDGSTRANPCPTDDPDWIGAPTVTAPR
jgi:hypothetical protein